MNLFPHKTKYQLCLFGSACLAAIEVATAQPATEPFADSFVTDGYVQAMAKNGNTLYFGGGFNLVGVRTGGGVPVSATTGAAESSYPVINGLPGNAIPDGQGGWFVTGAFTVVGDYLRTNLVHIRSDRTVDPDWAPMTGGAVTHAVLDGNNLYIAGSFTNVNGQVRNSVAVLDATTGTLGSWNPNAVGGASRIFLADTNLIICGAFTSVNGQSRNYLVAVNKTTGLLTSWNPNPSSSVTGMTIANNHLYVFGGFSTIASQSRPRLASFNLADYSIDPWSPAFGGSSILAIGSYQNQIFVGGQFTSIGGAFRTNIAALDATTGVATSWDAHQPYITSSGFPTYYVTALNVYSNAVYVAGPLSSIGGQVRPYAAALDINTGNALPWDPKPNLFPSVFSKVGDTIYLGGLFSAVNCIDRTNLAAFDLSTKQFTAWNPNLVLRSTTPPVNAMVVANNQVFVGGFFNNVGGAARTNLVALDLVNGTVQDWSPDPNGEVYSLATGNGRLFVGGTFNSIAGNALNYFADFDLASGTLTGWNPAISAFVQAMAVDGNTLYAGGLFTSVSGQTRRRIAAFDLISNSLTAWNANLTNGSYVDAISVSAGRIFIGGSFNVINGSNRTNFAGLDAATAQVLPFVANADSFVYGVEATSNMVFIAGNFLNVSGQKHSSLAALDLNLNSLANWNPNGDFYGKTVRVFDNNLYAGGVFFRLAGMPSRGIARFPLSLAGTPSVISKTVKRTPDGSFQFQCVAPGLPQVTVQSSSNLSFWQTAQIVPLTSGNGMFTETINAGTQSRFYRLSIP